MRPGRWPTRRAHAGSAWRRRWAAALLAAAVLIGALGCAQRSDTSASMQPGTTAGPAATAATSLAWVLEALRGSPVWASAQVDVQAGPVANPPQGTAWGADLEPSGSRSRAGSGRDARVVAVVGTLPEPELSVVGEIAAEAVRTVDRAWTRPWPGRLLVVAPADRAQWQAIAGVPAGIGASRDGTGTPAVNNTDTDSDTNTDPDAGASSAGGAEGDEGDKPPVAAAMTVDGADGSAFVVIDPIAWQAARQVGRRALLIHEAVHVAMRADTAPDGASRASSASAPLWLSEGYAQYVAYEAVGVEPGQIAGDLLARIRRDGPPRALPGEAELTGPVRQRLDAYALAWLACGTLAARAGPDAPRRAMEAGSVTAAGIDEPALTRAWREDLRRLARTQDRSAF